MRWMVWNIMGCLLWIAGLLYLKGNVAGDLLGGGPQFLIGLGFGISGLILLMWVNLLDVS